MPYGNCDSQLRGSISEVEINCETSTAAICSDGASAPQVSENDLLISKKIMWTLKLPAIFQGAGPDSVACTDMEVRSSPPPVNANDPEISASKWNGCNCKSASKPR